jgi:hypothetical protein
MSSALPNLSPEPSTVLSGRSFGAETDGIGWAATMGQAWRLWGSGSVIEVI